LYALRDVTATVESIPLIASSIMSKKLAAGIDALVLDVKQGNGAFLPEPDRADALARTMIGIGERYGRRVIALVTAMDRPLGWAIGNALEVEEAVLTLRGEGPPDVRVITVALAAEMLIAAGATTDAADARNRAAAALDDGRALERMRQIVQAQGGNPAVLDDPAVLPQAPVRRPVEADRTGIVDAMDVRALGRAAVELGAGRRSLDARIDPAVGFHLTVKPGDAVTAGERIGTVFAADTAAAEAGALAVRAAVSVGDRALEPLPLISRRITAHGVEAFDA
ncbi:MAG: thymidine phosphorylase, partial [Longimicrobiales bacterium]